jgi:uncharacterized RmlC-like cupin family protein
METKQAAIMACVLRGGEPYRSPQGTVYTPGVSTQSAGARALFLGIVTLPPGERTRAHVHEHHESAFYLLSGGEVELWSGPQLEHVAKARPGDYLFIPAGVPHVAVNRSNSEPAVFIGARTDPAASEPAAMTPHLDARVE